jgi:amphiphysin
MLSDFENIYGPIVGSDGNKYAQTPQEKLEQVHALKNGYSDLKTEMLEEVALIEKQIVAPAKDARTSVKAYMKVIKKREDKKLDYERYNSRVESLQKNTKRTDRQNTSLSKHQSDLDAASAVCWLCGSLMGAMADNYRHTKQQTTTLRRHCQP